MQTPFGLTPTTPVTVVTTHGIDDYDGFVKEWCDAGVLLEPNDGDGSLPDTICFVPYTNIVSIWAKHPEFDREVLRNEVRAIAKRWNLQITATEGRMATERDWLWDEIGEGTEASWLIDRRMLNQDAFGHISDDELLRDANALEQWFGL